MMATRSIYGNNQNKYSNARAKNRSINQQLRSTDKAIARNYAKFRMKKTGPFKSCDVNKLVSVNILCPSNTKINFQTSAGMRTIFISIIELYKQRCYYFNK